MIHEIRIDDQIITRCRIYRFALRNLRHTQCHNLPSPLNFETAQALLIIAEDMPKQYYINSVTLNSAYASIDILVSCHEFPEVYEYSEVPVRSIEFKSKATEDKG